MTEKNVNTYYIWSKFGIFSNILRLLSTAILNNKGAIDLTNEKWIFRSIVGNRSCVRTLTSRDVTYPHGTQE